ncbi:PAS domain S-box protein [Maribacter sp. R86514]|uniref:PAS domain S-box protein n=1 Tax=Maribacter sp. R86514 TaxID=3093854 RepID=UPI0037CC6B12
MSQYPNNPEYLEKYHQIFIEQAPTAIAMLDKNMIYLAVSKCWLKDYKLEEQNVIGQCHYDVFPEIGDDWKKDHQNCLKGEINVCEEAPFKRADGSLQWIYWDVRPWYNTEGEVGGLLMHTGDITEQKERELEKKRFETIVSDCSEIARIGTWEINTHTNQILWSDMLYEIHDVSKDFNPSLEILLELIEEEQKRDFLEKCMLDLLEKGIEMNEEFKIRTPKGNLKFIKTIGKAEYVEGLVTKVFGIVQDITAIKESERKLSKANKELEAIFNSKSIAVITTDKDGVINRFNSGAEKLLGYSAKEMIGLKKPNTYLLQDELDKFRDEITLKFKGNTLDNDFNYRNADINDTRQWQFKKKNGEKIPVLATITAINNSNSENEGFISVATNITKIKSIKDELRTKNDLLNLAERISLIGHWKWDPINDIGSWSDNLYSIFDYDKEPIKITFKLYFDMILDEDKEMVLKHFENANETKIFQKLTHRVKTFSGNIKTIDILAKVFCNEKGELLEMIGTCQDVTEAKEAERKLIAAKEDLEIFTQKLSFQNQQLADFTHITSHNLRAPVANLNSLLEIYEYIEDEEEKKEIFGKFSNVIDHLTTTLNTLVEALKTKVGDASENLTEIDLNSVHTRTIQILGGEILKNNVNIKADFSVVSNIIYNQIYIESIFLNLIGNAIKYKSQDRVPEISITSEYAKGKTILKFQDNGLGIDMKKHGHKLFGLNKVFHRHPDAKGVGLFLTKTQVEAMGGTITANSEVNVGTTFTIIL